MFGYKKSISGYNKSATEDDRSSSKKAFPDLKGEIEGSIELEGMEFHAFHGCLEKERQEGNTFIVDFYGEKDLKKAAASDDLKDTVDYSRIYDIVSEQMAIPSNLLENVAGRILEELTKEFGNDFGFLKIRVSKQNPPVNGKCAWSRVTATYGMRYFENLIG